jgi:signal transduction histidine kinase
MSESTGRKYSSATTDNRGSNGDELGGDGRSDGHGSPEQARIEPKRGGERAEPVNEAQRQFLLVLTHEMRTPLSAILLWTKLLRRGPVNAEEMREGLQAIQDSAEEQRLLLDGLFEMANVASGRVRLKPQSVKIMAVMRAAVDEVMPVAVAKGIDLRTNFGPDVGAAMADYDLLRRAIGILMANCITSCPVPGQVDIHLARRSDVVEIRIADSGRTISPIGLANLFNPLIEAHAVSVPTVDRVKLSIAKELIVLHEGSIQAFGPGSGVTFIVRLPQTNSRR